MVSRRRAAGVVAGALVLGLSIGGSMVAFAGDNDTPPDEQTKAVTMPDGRLASEVSPGWTTNEFGLTVGLPTPADVAARNLPDLAPSETDDGKPGFILAKVHYYKPRNPDEAAAQTRERLNEDGDWMVKIYGPDGKTQIGTSNLGHVEIK